MFSISLLTLFSRVSKEDGEKLSRKYVSPYNYRKYVIIEEAYDKVNSVLDQIIEIQDKYMKKGKNEKDNKDKKIIDL